MPVSVIVAISAAAVLLALLFVELFIELPERRRRKRALEKLRAENPEMSDDDFAIRLDPGNDAAKQRAILIRNQIAESFQAPREVINPDTKLESISATARDGGDSLGFILDLEVKFGIPIPDEKLKGIDTVRQLVQLINLLIEEQPTPVRK